MFLPADTTSLFQADFSPEELAGRRAKLLALLEDRASALIQGAGPVDRSESFRQTNEFYYLCGIETPQAYLLLDGRNGTTTLFLPHRNHRQERSEGPALSSEDEKIVKKLSGVDEVCPSEEMEVRLQGIQELYTPHSPAEGRAMYRDELLWSARLLAADPWDMPVSRESRFRDKLQSCCPDLRIKDLSPLLDRLRLMKSPREIDLMQLAGELTALGVREAIRCTRPGLVEYQLGAVAQYIHRFHGASGEGYRPIIASGPNIWLAHYFRNNRILQEGDVVLMDYAPDFHYYTSDIGRTWPVSGKYTPQQRELYGFITLYHQALLRLIRPGVLPTRILFEAAGEMAMVIEGTPFSRPIYEQAARRALEFRGHLSHPVGMAVHDVGSYWDCPLEPGLVFSVDPQMWIPEEELYIRVEDTVVVTADGIENLTALAPLDLDEIEALVGEGPELMDR